MASIPQTARRRASLPAITAALSILLVAGCASLPRVETIPANAANAASAASAAAEPQDCVVLLHGVNRSFRAMRPMAEGLRLDGYTTVNVDYPSRAGTIDVLAPLAVDNGVAACRSAGAERIHFVTHSIGGILLRYAHARSAIDDIGRVVMLAPPNQGSEIVDKTRGIPGARLVGGEALLQLGTDEDSVPARLPPVDFELGIVAGTRTMNPWMSAMLPNPDDGKVSVARTRVDGMSDFLMVNDNHHYIVEDELVIRNTREFIRNGSFLHDEPGASSDKLN